MTPLERGEETELVTPYGTSPITLRHKHDGCWELYQDLGDPFDADIIHVELDDWPGILAQLNQHGDMPAYVPPF